jgi:hypothetical protein
MTSTEDDAAAFNRIGDGAAGAEIRSRTPLFAAAVDEIRS